MDRARRPRPGLRAAVATVAAALALETSPAHAQCGANRTTCSTCHDEAHAAFVRTAPWHADHAFADLCTGCHAGNGEATTMAAAHERLVAPLAGEGARCASCHDDRGAGLARRYEEVRAAQPPRPPPPRTPPPSGTTATPSTTHDVSAARNAIAALIAVALALALAITSVRREAPLRDLARRLRQPAWSPYLGGVLLGLLVTVSTTLFGHRLSGAGAYQHLSGLLGRHLSPSSVYWRHVMPAGFTWEMAVAIGALAGALVSSRLARTFAWRTMPDAGWTDVFGGRVAVRWAIAFGGSMLAELGAGIAGGCTASLAVSGGAVLAPSAFLFMAGMFAGGIPAIAVATWLGARRREGRAR
ncbi:MAG: YeeE/YedE family protein [Deltaproteobacteria bacterium]|nr:YeeE/YedE family protein [Deltaproteobacteria bacterium]